MNTAAASFALDPKICDEARRTRDARFDGLFFTAVKSTGIYCRPVCPAPLPKTANIVYYPNAAAAASAGFRPCLRCRPEAAPGPPLWRAGDELVRGALRLIEHGALDRAPVAALAARIGVGERHLRRLFEEHLGASPLDVAATRRVLFAKKLISETNLPMTDVALAAGYQSLRRFNAAFRAAYAMTPRAIRRGRAPLAAAGEHVLRLPYRPPFDFAATLRFFARRAIPGIEAVDEICYARRFVFDGVPGTFAATGLPGQHAIELRIRHQRPAALLDVATRVRRLFDLDADAAAIHAALARDRRLRPLLRRFPGVRVGGVWDGFEAAVRAVLGQQVTVAAARTLASRLVARHGVRDGDDAELGIAFPTPQTLAQADLGALGITRARAATIAAVSRAVADGTVDFRPEQRLDDFIARWTALPGIGDWTAHYLAMRTLGHPDAFPAGDIVLRKALVPGTTFSAAALESESEAWRPWRAYAVLLLWRSKG